MHKTVPDVDAFGCFTIKMRIIKMYMLQMVFKVHVTTIIKLAGIQGVCARARHQSKHPTKGIAFNLHN